MQLGKEGLIWARGMGHQEETDRWSQYIHSHEAERWMLVLMHFLFLSSLDPQFMDG